MVAFKIKRGLGRGLSSLIGDSKIDTNLNKLSISDLIRNKNLQTILVWIMTCRKIY